MSTQISFKIQDLPKRINEGHGSAWKVRYAEAEKWKRLVDKATVDHKPDQPFKTAKLTLIRRSSAAPDYDGLVYAFKVVIDAMVKLGILENDKMDNIGIPEYKWERVKPKQGYIEVIITHTEN